MAFRINKNALLAATEVHSGWQRQAISPEIGNCYVDRLILEPGLSIAYSSYTPNRDLIEESVIERETNTLSMTFGLEGHSSYQSKKISGETFSFEPNHTTVTTFGNGVGERRYNANKKVNQLRILVDGSIFKRYGIPFQTASDRLSHPIQHRHAQTSANSDYYIKRLISLMNSNKTERPLEKNILALNLISEQLALLQTTTNNANVQHSQTLSMQDEFKITQAKLFMEQNMHQPLTLAYICQKVSISESKFKFGFKRIYNTTPYKMLLDIRMNKAWELLSTGLQVAQTAYAVGYEHPSNFSAAFARFYGRSPKSIASLTRQ